MFRATVLGCGFKNNLVQKLIGLILLLTASPVLAQPLQITAPSGSAPAVSPPQPEPQPEPRLASEIALTEIAEQFIDLVATGKIAQARELLNPTLKAGWTLEQMQDEWDRLQQLTGSYQRRGQTQMIDGNLVLIDLEFERATDNLFVIFDDQQQIQGIDFPLQVPRL